MSYDYDLYTKLECYPGEVVPIFDLISNKVFKEIIPQTGGDMHMGGDDEDEYDNQLIQVRPFNLKKSSKIRELDPKDIDRLISIKGIVIRSSDIIPEMKEAAFRCYKCHHMVHIAVERARIIEPKDCERCRSQSTFAI